MSAAQHLLAIDQGTSSSRTVIFDQKAAVVASAQQEFPQEYPQPGWVEHDPEAIWKSVLEVTKKSLVAADARNYAGLGITNQRETTLIWDRKTGECVHHAIVWQDRRTADYCQKLKSNGVEESVTEKTGLRLDPYFSATKIAWILDNVANVRQRAENGQLAFGTIDCFLLWRLTGGRVHATDASNASRTLLFNIHTQEWDRELLELFDVPESLLPEVKNCADDFGVTDRSVIGVEIPICGIAGDQQAALIGQAGFQTGATKSTYGTGCFVIANTGDQAVQSGNNLLTTVAYRLGWQNNLWHRGQYLRRRISHSVAARSTRDHRVPHWTARRLHKRPASSSMCNVVPAFAGLGAPYWDPRARGAILGLSRDSGINEIVTASATSSCLSDQRSDQRNVLMTAWIPASFASMAAWSQMTGSCNSWPTWSM